MFYSYKPYLQIALSRECIITFNEKGVYIAKTPEEEKLLREYAKNTRAEEKRRKKEQHDFYSLLRM